MLFHSENQARTSPTHGGMELISVCARGDRYFAVRTVALDRMTSGSRPAQDGRLHGKTRIPMIDPQGYVPSALRYAALIALLPRPEEIRSKIRSGLCPHHDG